ncbi:MAG TPA: TetR family transcriptional regulator [Nocardioidaceae bacterium]|nr:TetR family transcriptional regulator [Nocardioidaceae bacterium]
MTQSRPYGGRTLDQRRDARREQLIETGLDCLHEEGLSGISVRTICSRAKLTPRYFYENFANLDELLVALVDHVGSEVSALGIAAMEAFPDDLTTRVHESLRGVFAVCLTDPRKASVLLASAAHEAMQARQQQRFVDYAELVVDNLAGPDAPEFDRQRLRPMALFLIGGSVELISAKLTGLIELDDDQLVEQCTDMFLAAYQAVATTSGSVAN